MSKIREIKEDEFELEVVKSESLVLLDFYADWCGPCKALGPVLEEVQNDLATQAKILKVNIDSSPELAQRFGIRSVPTMLIFQGGNLQRTLVGVQGKEQILDELKSYTLEN